MQGRYAVNQGGPEWQRFAPIQFVDGADPLGLQPSGYPGRNDELRLATIRQPAQGGKIQVIVVIVAEEYGVDGADLLTARPALRRRPHRGERLAFRPNRISQNVEALCWRSSVE
jgi:hypothetical protein